MSLGQSMRKVVSKFFTRPSKRATAAKSAPAADLDTAEIKAKEEARARIDTLHARNPAEWHRRKRRRQVVQHSRRMNR